jgi:hypothetical protein
VEWIDRAVALVKPVAGSVTIRGDTDFTHTGYLDRWDGEGTKFILGMDAHPKIEQLAQALPESAWRPLERMPKYTIETEPRRKGFRYKEEIVVARGYENQKLVGESVAEMEYRPGKCKQAYRVVVLRKNIVSGNRGHLFDGQAGTIELGREVRWPWIVGNGPRRRTCAVGEEVSYQWTGAEAFRRAARAQGRPIALLGLRSEATQGV